MLWSHTHNMTSSQPGRAATFANPSAGFAVLILCVPTATVVTQRPGRPPGTFTGLCTPLGRVWCALRAQQPDMHRPDLADSRGRAPDLSQQLGLCSELLFAGTQRRQSASGLSTFLTHVNGNLCIWQAFARIGTSPPRHCRHGPGFRIKHRVSGGWRTRVSALKREAALRICYQAKEANHAPLS